MKPRDVNWGCDAAENDRRLFDYYVQMPPYGQLRRYQKRFLIGRKGTGKTALQLKLADDLTQNESCLVLRISAPTIQLTSSFEVSSNVPDHRRSALMLQLWSAYFLRLILAKIGSLQHGQFAHGSYASAREFARSLALTVPDPVEVIRAILSKVRLKLGSLGEAGVDIADHINTALDSQACKYHIKNLLDDKIEVSLLLDDIDVCYDGSAEAKRLLVTMFESINELTSFHHNLHVVVASHEAVYKSVLAGTPQSDKLRDSVVVEWNKDAIKELLAARIRTSLPADQRRLSGSSDDYFHLIFPAKVGRKRTDEWIANLTLCRPRDALQLARIYSESIQITADAASLRSAAIRLGEWKINDLATEYHFKYQGLAEVMPSILNMLILPTSFLAGQLHEACASVLKAQPETVRDWLRKLPLQIDERILADILAEVGIIVTSGSLLDSRTRHNINGELCFHPCLELARAHRG